MTNAAHPTPEQLLEMLQDTAGARMRITVTENEAVIVLMQMAILHQMAPTCDQPDCDECNLSNTLFWEISNALTMGKRIAYQKALRESGIELPPAPWEVVSVG